MKLSYNPPFSISPKSINLIADISAQIERYAIKTYDAFSSLNPFSVKDLLKAHGLMMEALIDDAGHFRRSGVGVFSGAKAVHVAPPAGNVPHLMNDLFDWLKKSDDHLLIKSCVFHYEFEFIHPFIDGNGRLGRLWQSLILSKLHPIFEHLPVENIVFQNQQQYYDAITQSTKATACRPFIEFMLEEILTTLNKRQGEPLKTESNGTANDTVNDTVILIKMNQRITIDELALKLNKSRRTITRIIKKLQEYGVISRIGSDKTGHWQAKDE
jgi:Fic family protein